MPDFKLPDLGEGVTEAEVDRWLVTEGQVIAEDDPLVEVITDKATAEIPSPYAGTVTAIHVAEGQIVPVGTVLVTIGDDGSKPAAAAVEEPESAGEDGVKATPVVRKLARELRVDLAGMTGTGPQGRVTREDVEAAAGTSDAEPIPSGPSPERREPFRGVRRKIAERMSRAHDVVPPVTHVEECDVTELDAMRRGANEGDPDTTRLSFLPFIVKAVVASLKQYPALNSSLDEDAQEIVFHNRFDIGVAVDTPAGLVVPVIRDADDKGLQEIAAEIERLGNAARAGTITAADLQGGTFTVTSPGPYGGLLATPLVFHPQAAILGVHRAVDRAVVMDGQIVVRKMMNLSITFDHRLLDGVTAAKFVLEVVRMLEDPQDLARES